ncbi:hypothetical protein HanRHA438_Chr09g0377631 [Helianthus annuus]|nr:hypothetical protein HanHA89_Chr09g0321221 [Helianthus annuus]KAJ0886291.1 hypothetical protein HanRHA438_Chr09g0377631 [Helianthus annuus]
MFDMIDGLILVSRAPKRWYSAGGFWGCDSFVDILFSFMTLPVGTIVKMLGKHPDAKFEALGSLNNLYQP